MSTRSTTHFIEGGKPQAIVYRQADGYPEGHGVELQEFFDDVERQTKDTRFNDPSYLAAKLVVWLADRFAHHYDWEDGGKFVKNEPLDFLSVGVCLEDPFDIEYRYEIHCENAERPVVKAYSVSCSYPDNVWSAEPVEIPAKSGT